MLPPAVTHNHSSSAPLRPSLQELWLVTSYCLSLLVVLTNSAVLLVVIRSASLHRAAYAFICNLAACDLIYGLCYAFFASAAYFPQLGGSFTVCRLALASFYASIGCSTVGITLIAGERFVAIRYPIAYSRLATRSAVTASIVTALLLVVGPVTVAVFLSARQPPNYPHLVGCVTQYLLPTWALVLASAHIALAQTVATCCYLTVFKVARLQRLSVKQQMGQRARRINRSWQLTASIGLLIFLFYFFWIPTWALQLYRLAAPETQASLTLAYFSACFSTLNSIVNIFVYWLRTREFQLAVKRILMQCGVQRPPAQSLRAKQEEQQQNQQLEQQQPEMSALTSSSAFPSVFTVSTAITMDCSGFASAGLDRTFEATEL